MKSSSLIVVLLVVVLLAGGVLLLLRGESAQPFALDTSVTLTPDSNDPRPTIAFAADRLIVPNVETYRNQGFLEGVELHSNPKTLRLSGWSAVEMSDPDGRLIVRDPWGATIPTGGVNIIPVDRPDVRAALGVDADEGRYGFTLEIPVSDTGSGSAWMRSLEVYAHDASGGLAALTPVSGRSFRTWVKSPEAFTFSIVFATPSFAEGAIDGGHVDVVEPGEAEGTVRIHGWAPFDARSPDSYLCLRLPRSVAPASIVAREAELRPDVPPVVDPDRPELEYGGFSVVLVISGSIDELREKGAFAFWSMKQGEAPVSVHIGEFD